MFQIMAEGFVLGLSLGATCLVTCGPVYLTFMLRQKRTVSRTFLIFGQILLGRFVGYAIFGIITGIIGSTIPDSIRRVITYCAFIILGGVLIYYGIGGKKEPEKCATKSFGKYITNPILLGFLTGLELCPPFLLAMVRSVSIGGAIGGFSLFMGFFAGTTLFLIPIAFLGVGSYIKPIRIVATIAAVAIGIWFFIQGSSGLVLEISQPKVENVSVVGVPEAPQIWIFSDDNWGDSLATYIRPISKAKISVVNKEFVDSIAALADTSSIVIWSGTEQVPDTLTERIGVIKISDQLDVKKLRKFIEFVSTYHFKRRWGSGFVFDWGTE
mgnify:CR=1 FL=1